MKSTIFRLFLLLLISQISACGVAVRGIANGVTTFGNSEVFHQGQHGELTEDEKKWAKIAWQYFENNYNAETGIVNSKDYFQAADLWQMSDTIAATIIAHEFKFIDRVYFDVRISTLLNFLNYMPLSYGKLPNKMYNAVGGNMVDAGNQGNDVGWSAIDIGRLLTWLKILAAYDSQYSEYVDKIILRWNFCEIITDCGMLYSANKKPPTWELKNEEEKRVGYLEYAQMGYSLWGFPERHPETTRAYQTAYVMGIEIPYDGRDPRVTGYSPVVSLPYLVYGLEYNWDLYDDTHSNDTVHTNKFIADIAERIYKVQEARYEQEKVFTARTDHPRTSEPYYLYDSIFAGGYAWNSIDAKGDYYERYALVSTRAVFGLWALWRTDYTKKLLRLINTLYSEKRGWYEGRLEQTAGYDKSISLSTNAMVLMSLFYKTNGKIFRQLTGKTHADVIIGDDFRRPNGCFPPDREACPLTDSDAKSGSKWYKASGAVPLKLDIDENDYLPVEQK